MLPMVQKEVGERDQVGSRLKEGQAGPPGKTGSGWANSREEIPRNAETREKKRQTERLVRIREARYIAERAMSWGGPQCRSNCCVTLSRALPSLGSYLVHK